MLVFQYWCSLVSSFSFWSWKGIVSRAVFPCKGRMLLLSALCLPFLWGIVEEQTTNKKNASCLLVLVLLPRSLWDITLQNLGLWGCLRFGYLPDQWSSSVYSLETSLNFEGLKEPCIWCIFAGNTWNESAHWCLEHGNYIDVEVVRNAFI